MALVTTVHRLKGRHCRSGMWPSPPLVLVKTSRNRATVVLLRDQSTTSGSRALTLCKAQPSSTEADGRLISDAVTADLVRRVQRGEPRAFEGLAKAFLRAAYSVALAIVRRPSDAEDVAQDALLIAFERIDTCRDPARFGGWLMQITRNQARNFLDRRRLRDVPAQEPSEFSIGTQAADDRGPERARLLSALELLSEAQREVVLLHDLEGWTHAEIGRALELSEVMSRQHLFQARRVLRGALEESAEGVQKRKVGGAQ